MRTYRNPPPCTGLQVPLLYNLNERQLWQMATALGEASFTEGQVVFRKGDPADTFYVVHVGAFTIFDGARGWAGRARMQKC